MDCRDALERLSDYQDDALPDGVAEKVSLHLKACTVCSAAARSLGTVRDHLRNLSPVTAPPELIARVREAVAREVAAASSGTPVSPADFPERSVLSRLRVPLEAAAVVLLVASVYWFRMTSAPPAIPPTPPAPPRIASSPPPPAPIRTARAAPRSEAASTAGGKAAAESGNRREGISSLPPDTPEPKLRVWSRADLPAAPVLRTSTNFERIAPGLAEGGPAAESEGQSRSAESGTTPPGARGATAAPPSRLRPLLPYGRVVSLDVAMEHRDGVEDRIGDAARRLGGTVEGTDRVVPDGPVAVRVLLPERTAPAFLEELDRIGKIPPEGKPARSVLPAGPAPGTVAYTVRLRVR